MAAYYNENDPFAAAWLRELIKAGHLAEGDVDERDVRLVAADELRGYTQCHFFAGIGVWSHALRKAGWSDDRPVWTGSCPCQPFSAAGKAGGVDDERHLWPDWFRLIDQCRPSVVLGEQVSSKAGLGWLDLVSADMEGAGYAIGAADLCAAGVGAPHIRQRLWFVAQRLADADGERHEGQHALLQPGRPYEDRAEAARSGEADRLADADNTRLQGRRLDRYGARQRAAGPGGVAGGLADPAGTNVGAVAGDKAGPQRTTGRWREAEGVRIAGTDATGATGGLADADVGHAGAEGLQRGGQQRFGPEDGVPSRSGDRRIGNNSGPGMDRPGAADSFWRDADWLLCRDGKWRPVEPGTFPLASGIAGRVGRLRGYGNSLCAPVATAFIEEVMAII